MNLDAIDRKLLNLVQSFPLTSEPYQELGNKLGISEPDVIRRIELLKTKGLVRQISPVFDALCLGYQTTLAAMRVEDDKLDIAERIIRQHPGVSHGYERDHYFNLWFTLAVSNGMSIEAEIDRIAASSGANICFSLPTVKRFKICAYFDMGGNGASGATISNGCSTNGAMLSPMERSLVNELQQDLPLVSRPFKTIAERLDIDEDSLLEQCRSLLQKGVMRRFGAAINHNKAGFKANAMTCWAVAPQAVDAAGKELASMRQVSHCYERKSNPHWRYNLFAMIHAHSRELCQAVIDEASERLGLKDCVALFSTREFKKTRNRYMV